MNKHLKRFILIIVVLSTLLTSGCCILYASLYADSQSGSGPSGPQLISDDQFDGGELAEDFPELNLTDFNRTLGICFSRNETIAKSKMTKIPLATTNDYEYTILIAACREDETFKTTLENSEVKVLRNQIVPKGLVFRDSDVISSDHDFEKICFTFESDLGKICTDIRGVTAIDEDSEEEETGTTVNTDI